MLPPDTGRTIVGNSGASQDAWAEPAAAQALSDLYQQHYRSLVQLAVLLVSDLDTAEEIVQDAFAGVYARWHALAGPDAALRQLRRSVIRGSRSAPHLQPAGDVSVPGPGTTVVAALTALTSRQREILVLRYFADLSEAEIASATGLSQVAVRTRAARAMASLRTRLRPD
jgi:DNA-directed RNA polymerase specialized sigma24 family protein